MLHINSLKIEPYFDTAGHSDDFREGTESLFSSTECVDEKYPSGQVPVLHAT